MHTSLRLQLKVAHSYMAAKKHEQAEELALKVRKGPLAHDEGGPSMMGSEDIECMGWHGSSAHVLVPDELQSERRMAWTQV